MNPRGPTNWPSLFLGAAVSILAGCMALYQATQLLRRMATFLAIVAALISAAAIFYHWYRRRRGW